MYAYWAEANELYSYLNVVIKRKLASDGITSQEINDMVQWMDGRQPRTTAVQQVGVRAELHSLAPPPPPSKPTPAKLVSEPAGGVFS